MIDTHCHLDLYDAPESIAQEAEDRQITTIAVTYLPSHFQLAEHHLSPFKYVSPALGLHPAAAKDHAKELCRFRILIDRSHFVGEIGLDFTRANGTTRKRQEDSFTEILDALRGKPRFITLHSRGAEDVVLAHLESVGCRPVVFHWFTGTRAQLCRVLDAGHLISVNPAMITTAKWDALIELVPQSSLLTESDGPFARHANRIARPSDITVVLEWVASRWRVSTGRVEELVRENFNTLMLEVRDAKPAGSSIVRRTTPF